MECQDIDKMEKILMNVQILLDNKVY